MARASTSPEVASGRENRSRPTRSNDVRKSPRARKAKGKSLKSRNQKRSSSAKTTASEPPEQSNADASVERFIAHVRMAIDYGIIQHRSVPIQSASDELRSKALRKICELESWLSEYERRLFPKKDVSVGES